VMSVTLRRPRVRAASSAHNKNVHNSSSESS